MKFNWKKVLCWMVVVLVVGFVLYSNMKEQNELQNNGKKNVYAVLPLSGSIAKSGQEYQQVLKLYQKVNPNNNLNFIYVDSAFIPSQAVSALQSKIVSADKPLVVVTGTTVALAVLDIVHEKGGFVLISGGAKPTNASKHNYWNFSSGNGLGMDEIASYLNRRYHNIAMFYPNSDYGVLTYNRLNEKLNESAKLIFKESFDTNISDVRTLVQKALQSNPEAVVVTGPANQNFINIFRILKEMDYKGDIIGDLTFNQPAVLNALDKKAEGIIFLTLDPLLSSPSTTEGKKFQELFKASHITPSFAHVEAYNMALFIEALAKQNDISQESILKMKNLETSSGKVQFLSGGDSKFEYVLATFQDGQIVPVEK